MIIFSVLFPVIKLQSVLPSPSNFLYILLCDQLGRQNSLLNMIFLFFLYTVFRKIRSDPSTLCFIASYGFLELPIFHKISSLLLYFDHGISQISLPFALSVFIFEECFSRDFSLSLRSALVFLD